MQTQTNLHANDSRESSIVALIRRAMECCVKGDHKGAVERLLAGTNEFPEINADLVFLCGVVTAIAGDL